MEDEGHEVIQVWAAGLPGRAANGRFHSHCHNGQHAMRSQWCPSKMKQTTHSASLGKLIPTLISMHFTWSNWAGPKQQHLRTIKKIQQLIMDLWWNKKHCCHQLKTCYLLHWKSSKTIENLAVPHIWVFISFSFHAVKGWKRRVEDAIGGSSKVSQEQSRLWIPQDNPCSCKVTLFVQRLLKQQTKGLTKLCLVWTSPVSLHQVRAGHVTSTGAKCGLSNKPIFPQPLCLSQQHKHGEEPEAHASGACLLRLNPDIAMIIMHQGWQPWSLAWTDVGACRRFITNLVMVFLS